MRFACCSITAIASGSCSAEITGTLRLMMAAFSPAIEASVVAEEFHVVHADRREHARKRRLDHIGGIEPAAEADFEQQHVGRMLCEQQEAPRRSCFEKGQRLAGIGALALFERGQQLVVADQPPPPCRDESTR